MAVADMTVGPRCRRRCRRRWRRRRSDGRVRTCAHAGKHVIEQVPQRGELIERDTVVGLEPILLPDLTEELRLADAVDAEVGLEISVELHDLARIARLLHDEVDEERFDLVA